VADRFLAPSAAYLFIALALPTHAQWDAETSNTKASLRAIHNASPGVAWASGTTSTILRSEDDGFLWQTCALPPNVDARNLDFRGLWAWDANRALALSSGTGTASRLYETSDGCAHWHLAFSNPQPTGFWDALAFWNLNEGIILGDPVNGRFTIFRTHDGGHHWSQDESPTLAVASKQEGAFAASNSALTLRPDGQNAYFVTGGPGGGRIFHLQFNTWTAVKSPFTYTTESAGLFSIAFRDAHHGVSVGGDYKQSNQRLNTAAYTTDGGTHWTAATQPPSGYRSAVAWDKNASAWIAVGPNGSDVSYDDGKSWRQFDKASWNALSLPWAAGPEGKIGRLNQSTFKRIQNPPE
jgi:photosystem II stability/assembly factor-like uncharacterized protein